MNSTDSKKAAADLRAKANQLEQDARSLRAAAQVLDPTFLPTPPPGGTSLREKQRDIILRLLAKGAMNLAEKALRERGGGMTRDELFAYVQKSGSKVTSLAGFGASLSRDKRFAFEGNGLWGLREWSYEPEPPSD
jgi:hypothetical protein